MYQIAYYASCFIFSCILSLIYIYQWHRRFDAHMTATFILVPIANLGYLLMYSVHDLSASTSLIKIVYFVGCFLPWVLTMLIVELCQIEILRWMRLATLLASAMVFFSVMSIGYTDWYYKSVELEKVGSVWIQHKSYGPLHKLHLICLYFYLATEFVAIIYSYRERKQVSRRILNLLFIPLPISMFGYLANSYTMRYGIELMPLTYSFAQLVYLLIVRRMVLYNVCEIVIESEVQSGDIGFITVDIDGRYLGSNETARRFLPELSLLTVDHPISETAALRDTVVRWLMCFQDDQAKGTFLYSCKDTKSGTEIIYSINVSYLYDRRRRCGYQIFIKDDTRNQKYIRLLDSYNSDLQKEVESKTERLTEMHDRFILGMATMVESRDNSTGGHIRRTSEGVRILTEAIRKGYYKEGIELTDEFCRNIIKAAPMHDLGKIAVDDAILRKPGRFTPEEYEKMKTHSAEGARIVHEILKDTDDEAFRVIAENMAHYHHERWDGSGYPDGLRGEEIPFEARIMAVADVYDALVSKRIYKDSYSFEKANNIIMEGMGSQFDPSLKRCYERSRPALERFYETE